jgi:hypothetical protein
MARHGGDKRGSSRDRAARKRWMLSPEAGFGGDGTYVPCVHGCLSLLSYVTVEADRIRPGGSYARSNVQPSCRSCNLARLDRADWTPPVILQSSLILA